MPGLGYDSGVPRDVAEIHTAVVIALFRIYRVHEVDEKMRKTN